MEKFFEQKFDLPEEHAKQEEAQVEELEAITEHQEERDANISFQFDVMIHGKDAPQEFAKENVLETIVSDPDATDIFYLKEKVADPLVRSESFRADHEFQQELREAFVERYKYFLIPGHVGIKGIQPPESVGFVVQRLDLAKAGLLKSEKQFYYYDPGRENNIPKKFLEHGLKIAAPETDLNRPPVSPTMAVFDTARRLGFYEKNSEADQRLLTLSNTFVERVDTGHWLSGAADKFYDENDITFMKLNRLLPIATLTGLIRDLTAGEKLQIKGNANFKKDASEIMDRVSTMPLPPALIEKYGLDNRVDGKSIIERQRESVIKSREYLESGKNVAEKTTIGRMIYVKADERGRYDKLPGSLPAVAASPTKFNGYVEVTPHQFLAFIRKEQLNGLGNALDEAAAKSGLHVHQTSIEGWERLSSEPDENIVAAFEKHVFQPKEKPAPHRTTKKKIPMKNE